MKCKSGWLLLAMVGALGLMAFRGQEPPPPNLSTPRATVRSFLAALNSQDTRVMQLCVKDSMDQDLLKVLFRKDSMASPITVIHLVEETDHDTAHVAVEFTMKQTAGQDEETADAPMADMFFLVKQGAVWQLTPDPIVAKRSPDTLSQARPLSFVVALIGASNTAKNVPEARKQARAAICLSNVRQVALGVLMYTQDHKEITPQKGSSYVDLIVPYTKNRQVFTCPSDADKSISYTFNSGVAGIPLRAIKSPAKTVMIYEGKAGQLDFRHDDHAAVGFMDGHCKMISSEEATSLIWTVPVPRLPVKPAKKKARK